MAKSSDSLEASSAHVHPPAEALVAYAEGGHAAIRDDGIEQHLVTCAECRDLVDDLRRYPYLDPPGADPERAVARDDFTVGGDEIEDALASTLAIATQEAEGRTARPVLLESARPESPASHSTWAHLLWAAALVAALGWGLSERMTRFEIAQAGSLTPLANASVVSLHAADDPLRSSPPGIDLAAGTTLVLADDVPFPADSYRAQLSPRGVGPGAEKTFEVHDLRPGNAGELTFFLPPSSLEAGIYVVVLKSADDTPWPRAFTLRVAP